MPWDLQASRSPATMTRAIAPACCELKPAFERIATTRLCSASGVRVVTSLI